MTKATGSPYHLSMYFAYIYGSRSPDPSTQNCAILLNDYGVQLGWAYNDFPYDVVKSEERWTRPLKYSFVEHAERNCLYNAARQGIKTQWSTMVSPWAACTDCARAIVQCSVTTLVRHKDAMQRDCSPMWQESIKIADTILAEGGVEIIELEGKVMPDGFKILHSGELWSP